MGASSGTSSGNRGGICRELVKRGWIVIEVVRSEDKLIQIQKERSHSFIPMVCDVSKKEDIENTSKQILKKSQCPSLFFLNAAIAGDRVIENPNRFDLKLHEKIMQVNYFEVLALG